MGVARYGSSLNLSYGKRGAVIETQYPPAAYGSSEIGDFVAPPPVPASKRSPLLDAVGGPPQIARPRVAPSRTERPAVEFETRVSNHPRSGGFIDAQRFAVVEPEPEPPPQRERAQAPSERPTEFAQWVQDRLGKR
jgi:hypothetical protein